MLNYSSNHHLSNEAFFLVLYQSFPKEVLYTYPDEDFCYFKDFPHKRLVFPVLKPTQTKNCSCALLYLIYNSYLAHDFFDDNFKYLIKQYDLLSFYSDFILQQQTSFQDCQINKNMQERIRACNFLLRLEQCSIKSIELDKNDFYFTVQDWQMVAKKSHLYLFISNQIVALVCLISNIVTLFIIRNKNINKEFKKIVFLTRKKEDNNLNLYWIELFILIKSSSSSWSFNTEQYHDS